MQWHVDNLIRILGKKDYFVTVRPTINSLARCSGLSWEAIGLPTSGVIYIHEPSLGYFKDREVLFILAHELSYISMNHTIGRIWWHLIEQLSTLGVATVAKTTVDIGKIIVELVKLMLSSLSPDHLTPAATELRDSEYSADCMAIQITRDPESAISCLERLSGGDLTAPSHTWELFGIDNLPAMSFGERITELQKCIDQHFANASS